MRDNRGHVVAIYIAPDKGVPMQKLDSVRAIEGVGLEGDRYAQGIGAWSQSKTPKIRHVTLIEMNAIGGGHKPGFSAAMMRRNLVVHRVDLNSLVGREFMVGDVKMRGVELCDPCDRPSSLCGVPDFKQVFDGKGGLRAEILSSGTIRKGDKVTILPVVE